MNPIRVQLWADDDVIQWLENMAAGNVSVD